VTNERRAELAASLQAVQERIRKAATLVDRDPREITIVAVTKRFPVTDVVALRELGVTDVAENRHQEAVVKHQEYLDATGDESLRWHFIGQVQSNKAAAITRYADSVDTVDRVSVVGALARGAVAADRIVQCLVQVSLAEDMDAQEGRGGCAPDEAVDIAAKIDVADGLVLAGVMGMAALGADPVTSYRRLALTASRVRALQPDAVVLSGGMSHDLEAAIAAGATQVRLGTAILGQRPALR